MISYSFKPEWPGDKEVTLILNEGTIQVKRGETTGYIQLAEISEVRLFRTFNSDDRGYVCRITLRDRSRLSILSYSCLGIGNTEYQANDFNKFVLELHKMLDEVDSIKFEYGKVHYQFYAWVGMVLLALVLTGILFLHWAMVLIIPVLIYFTIRYSKRNRLRIYDPSEIPADALPVPTGKVPGRL